MDSEPAPESTLRMAVLGGGSEMVTQVVRALPARPGLAIVILCASESGLAEQLRLACALPVTYLRGDVRLAADQIFIIPGDHDAIVRMGELVLQPPSRPRAPLDRLLRSAADELATNVAGVILAGHESDGILGLKRIKEAGGMTIAQEPTESVSSVTSRAAIATGMIDLVLPGAAIAARLHAFGHEPPIAMPALDGGPLPDPSAETLREILSLLRVRTGHEFAAYKRATLYRRITRRMLVCQTATLATYHQYLREHPAEIANLLRDFSISVTNFFRDPEAFAILDATVIPKLFAGKSAGDHLRVWVAGCATGEEAHSIGILLAEHASQLPEPPGIQIFATDIDEEALASARAGRYSRSIAVDVPRAYLERYFTLDDDHYRVIPELRERVLFSPHNLLRDPPFSRLDLICCRNLLIYLNRDAQDRVLAGFQFGLRPEGYLFLGTSEFADHHSLFAPLDLKNRIFSRLSVPVGTSVGTIMPSRWSPPPPLSSGPSAERTSTIGELHHRVVEQYAPPSVVVNDALEVVHLSEHAGRFLRIAGGEPTRQLLQIVHPALCLDLRSAIHAARLSQRGGDTRVVRFEQDEVQRTVELRVRTLDLAELGRGALLIMFDELDPEPIPSSMEIPAEVAIEPVVRELEEELHRTRDRLRTTVEQYETSVEELEASNEELQAINEELRSATEELETSKEELQSVNEELTTVNHELQLKLEEIGHTNSDLQNLMASIQIGVVFLDRELKIKRFTPRVQDLFNVIDADVGRPFAHLTHHLDTTALPDVARDVLQHLRTVECEVGSDTGRRYLARILPYRSIEDRIEGVVLRFVDVTDVREAVEARRRSEAALEVSEARLRMALRAAPMVVLTLDRDGAMTWGYVRGVALGAGAGAVVERFAAGDATRFLMIAAEVIAAKLGQRAELDLVLEGERRTYDFRFEPTPDGASAVGFDITPSKHAELVLREADRRKDEFLAALSHELRNPLTPLKMALDVSRLAEGHPDAQREAREVMERQVAQLTQLVDELLDLSRITQDKIQIERVPVDPTRIIEAALEATRPLIQQHHHELRVVLPEVACRVLGDFTRLTQVLTNLLSNAAKYTPDRGHIELLADIDEARRVLVLRVRDNGMGIPPDMLPRIFEIFVQCRDAVGRAQGGLGIGLNLVHKLVDLHGGRVFASSDGDGAGSEFVVELPTVL